METAVKTTWKIDPTHSEVQFKIRHLVISTVTGQFSEFEGSLESESSDFSDATFHFSAKVASISTNNTDRDTHLRSADFFDAENHPELQFHSTRVEKSGDDYTIHGDMTIKGVTHPLTLKAELGGVADDPYGQTKAGFEITGKINRKDFGLTWSAVTETGGVVVSDEVKLIANVQFVKQA